MKNDIKKVDFISFEMDMNDKTYRKMQFFVDDLESILIYDDLDDTEAFEFLDKIYFGRRVLSVLANNDIPVKAAIGLFCSEDIICELYDSKEEYIGDSDADTDIFEFVIEYGYREYDRLSVEDRILDVFKETLENYIEMFEDGDEDDEEYDDDDE